jgi:hypothetical protein
MIPFAQIYIERRASPAKLQLVIKIITNFAMTQGETDGKCYV